jgi:hypothetical protein
MASLDSHELRQELSKGFVCFRSPYKSLIFLGELSEWQYNLRIIPDELAVEVGESKKIVDIVDRAWSLPFYYGLNFPWVHKDIFG